jgi:hypothetical protein
MKSHCLLLIVLSACSDEGDRGLVRVHLSGVFDPASLELGEVAVNGSKSSSAMLVNTGELPLSDLSPIVPDDRFAIEMTEAIPAGAQGEVTVSFAPDAPGEASAKLALQPAGEDPIELDVHATGVLAPIFTFDPPALDFGVVALGGEATMSIAIGNTGSAQGSVSAVEISAPFSIAPSVPFAVAEGDSVPLDVDFRPQSSGEHTAKLVLTTNGLEPMTTIELAGRVEVGALVCTPDPVDFGEVVRGGSTSIELRCVSTGSLRFLGAEKTGSELFSIRAPPASDLGQDASITIGVAFAASGPQSDHEGAIVLRYQNAEGDTAANIPLTARVVAPDPGSNDIAIFLFWDTELTDMDLHLIEPGGVPFDSAGSDCYFQRPTADWGVPGDSTDDPFLDRDDFDGVGPENINLANAAPGSYEVYVHYYADNRTGASIANLEVHGGGTTLGVFERSLGCDDFWHAGTIVWDGSQATFSASTDVAPAGRGLCF